MNLDTNANVLPASLSSESDTGNGQRPKSSTLHEPAISSTPQAAIGMGKGSVQPVTGDMLHDSMQTHVASLHGGTSPQPQPALLQPAPPAVTSAQAYPEDPAKSAAKIDIHAHGRHKSMTEVQTEELWIVYKPFLHYKTAVVYVSALLLIWLFAWLYLSSTWDPLAHTHNLKVFVLDCDMGISNSTISSLPAALQPYAVSLGYAGAPLGSQLLASSIWNPASEASEVLDWHHFSCGAAGGHGCGGGSFDAAAVAAACRRELVDAVDDADAWGAIWVPDNTSAVHLGWALRLPSNATGIPPAAANTPPSFEYIYGRGRSYSTYSYLNAVLDKVFTRLVSNFGSQLATSQLASSGVLVPLGLVTPLRLVSTDLHPVRFFGQNLATYVFCILVWLGAGFAVAVSTQYKMRQEMIALNALTPEQRPHPLRLFGDLCIKTGCAMLATFVLVVLLVCVVWALGRGEEDWSLNAGHAIAFTWYLSWSYLSLNSVLLHALGPDRFNSLSALLLILQLMSSGGIIAEDLSPRFFHVGHGLPFYYGTRGLRTIFFGGQENLMYINWLVLTAWNVLGGGAALAYVTMKVHRSGTTARPIMVPANTVGDLMLVGGGL